MLKEIQNRKQSLQYVCGDKFRERVDAAIDSLPKKKDGSPSKKSVNFLTGKAGRRTTKESVRFTDEEKAKKWMIHSCMNFEQFTAAVGTIRKTDEIIAHIWGRDEVKAIGSLNKTPFLEYIKQYGEMPDGVELVPAVDNFYPQVEKLVLPEASEADRRAAQKKRSIFEAQELLKGENDDR